jgi:hypothetical protein
LFFADKDEKVCERVKEFFKEKKDVKPQPEICFTSEGIIEKRENGFVLPPVDENAKIPNAMSVTAFKTYKQCPYRFYLGNILHLEHLDDSDNELPASTFGTLIHKALEEFGSDEATKNLEDADEIFQVVRKTFEKLSAAQFGKDPKPAVLFQIELAKQRLAHFADKQAEWRGKGWEIIDTEKSFSVDDGIKICEGMALKGKIDRIDRKIKDGTVEYTVLDYKSGDNAEQPDKAHLKGKEDSKEWIDFQLPLYRYLLQEKGGYEGTISLGYFTLPKDNTGGVKLAKWNEDGNEGYNDTAIEECRGIAKAILKGKDNIKEIFAISEKPPKYDNFPEICLVPQVKRKW